MMPHEYSIRRETPDDSDAIRSLTADAFASSEFGHNGEAQLGATLRSACADESLSLVACDGDQNVGHVLFTPATIRTPREELHGMGLAPLSVTPDLQRRGIGSRLVSTAMEQLFDEDCSFVIVLGDGRLYSRFGFAPAADAGVQHGFSGIPLEVFYIRFHPRNERPDFRYCNAYYAAEFGPQHIDS